MNVFTTVKLTTSLILAAGLTTHAYAYSGCTANSLNGTYGLQFSGVLTPEVASGVGGAKMPEPAKAATTQEPTTATNNPVAGFARLYLDGAGSIIGNSVLSVNGAWSEGPLTGEYTVGEDCTASFTLTDASAGAQHFHGVVVSRGDGAVLRQVDKGVAVSASMSRTRNACQPSDLAGYFGFRTGGTIQDSGPFSSIGALYLNTDGTATALESRFSGGVSSVMFSQGLITVSPDCTLTMALASTTDGALANYRGILVNNLKDVLLVRADAGASITGTMVVQ